MNDEVQNYSGQTLNQPIYVDGTVFSNPHITIPREPFLLERYDFDKLIKGESIFIIVANIINGSGIGLFINMVAKFFGSKIDTNIQFDNWEVYSFIFSLVLIALCYFIDFCVPNERRKIVKNIKKHFENT